jgi:hypothetical protein
VQMLDLNLHCPMHLTRWVLTVPQAMGVAMSHHMVLQARFAGSATDESVA